MPSPLAHILSGATVYLIGANRQRRGKIALGVCLLGSLLPDFDFLPGLLIGEPRAYHHGISHSVGFAVMFGAAVLFVLRYLRRSDIAMQAGVMGALAYGFHAILDAVSVNEGAKAVPLLWPIIPAEFGINLGLLGRFHHDGLADGLRSVIRLENLSALAREVMVLGIPSLLVYVWTAKRRKDEIPSLQTFEGEDR